MDYKKLIGTIIGVTLFAVLIAGATFAWLTFGTTIVSTNVTTSSSMNFLVDYTQGQTVSDIPMLDSTLATPEKAAQLSVTAKKHSGSVDGHLIILLTSNATTGKESGVTADLLTDGIVRWVICRGQCTTNFNNAVNAGMAQGTTEQVLLNEAAFADGHNKKNDGTTACTVANDLKTMTKSSATKPAEDSVYGSFTKDQFSGYSVCNGLTRIKGYANGSSSTSNIIGTTATTYYIYFWLDGATINNGHKNQTYSGYIHASASQLIK